MSRRCDHGFLAGVVACPSGCHAGTTGKVTKRNTLFIEMAGKTIGQLTVVSRAKNLQAGARWNVLCSCGAREIRFGTEIRDRQRKGRLVACRACQQRRPA